MPSWLIYIKHNFQLSSYNKAIAELRKMIGDLQTPYYRYRKSNRTSQQRVKHVHIPPRRLDDLELARLQELLSIYEAKPKAWQANIDTNPATEPNIKDHDRINEPAWRARGALSGP